MTDILEDLKSQGDKIKAKAKRDKPFHKFLIGAVVLAVVVAVFWVAG